MMGSAISEASLTNEVKKSDTLVQVERLALCPAHRGRRSGRPAALCGNRDVSDKSSLERIGQNLGSWLVQLFQQAVVNSPRESSGEALCQRGVSGFFLS